MKKITFILISSCIISCILFLTGCEEHIAKDKGSMGITPKVMNGNYTDYYWYKGEQIPLIKNTNKKYILFRTDNLTAFGNTLKQNSISVEPSGFHDYICAGIANSPGSITKSPAEKLDLKWAIIDNTQNVKSLQDITEVLYEAPFYKSGNGNELGLSNLFYVKLRSDSDIPAITALAAKHHVSIEGQNIYMPLWYTLSCSGNSTGNSLEMANLFYETGIFEACEPDLMMDKQLCTNDPYFGSQWALKNTGQSGGTSGIDIGYCNARSITAGSSNVIVAVLDHGIQLNHPDITNISNVSYDSETNTSPSTVRGNHGTACAGIIGAAADNGTGVAGIAPGITLMSISNTLLLAPNSPQTLANGLNFAARNGASVISNSWGHENLQSSLIDDAIYYALTYGRNNLGCVVVFATGNDYSGTVGYPARSNPDIIAVGALNRYGSRSSFSQYGSELDIVAPGEDIYTTDRTGSDGYVSGDYYGNFTGTSAACPHVAAVAALCLSVNPQLTQKQVADIIEATARKVGSYTYGSISGRPNGTWNNQMGYGMLDAYSAVAAAGNNIINLRDITYTTSTTVVGSYINAENVTVSNGAKLTLRANQGITLFTPFTIDANCEFEMSL